MLVAMRGHVVGAGAVAAVVIASSLYGCDIPFFSHCSHSGEDCTASRCCADAGLTCYEKDKYWASCKASCTPGIDPGDVGSLQTSWSCNVLSEVKPQAPPDMLAADWTAGTWTTGYWDCCKPSCGWAGKGNFDNPVASCDVQTGQKLNRFDVDSVCQDDFSSTEAAFEGTRAAACADNSPFVVNDGLTMGFAAVNAVEEHQLCGQCFELVFTNEKHSNGAWGGASMNLVGKAMIVQVTNIGGDVTGQHSFDIQIPGAGQGIFHTGCARQYDGFEVDDFDCGTRLGGCEEKSQCDRLPSELQSGCRWRFEWYDWLRQGDATNNPYVIYRRVRCPQRLVDISGSTPLDDGSFAIIDEQEYVSGKAPMDSDPFTSVLA